MNASSDFELMRASMLLESDPAAAARQAGAILERFPGHDAASLLLAAACRRMGDSAGAVPAIESLATAHPSSALLQLELARSYAAQQRRADAIAALKKVVGLDATLADAWQELAAQHFLADETLAGDVAYLNYSRLTPEAADLADAHVAFNANRLDAAEALVRTKLGWPPKDPAGLQLLASIAARRGDDSAAEAHWQHALLVAPGSARAREELVRLWIRHGRIEAALPLIERLMAAEPHNGGLVMLKAEALRLAERHEEGLAIVRGMLQKQPDNPEFWLIAGHQERFAGNPQQSIDAYRQAIALRPGYGEAYWALSNLKTFRFSAQDVDSMQRALAGTSTAAPDIAYLQFALGKALEDEQQYAAAFERYAQGNLRTRATFPYEAKATTAFVQRFKETFTREFFAAREGWGEASIEPIFIVGVPRSGSTLLEQILACHTHVEATRELSDVPTIARELQPYPQSIATLDRAAIEALAQRYLRSTQTHRLTDKPRFVDKMLGNFVSLSLIHLMFPKASIIDCRRDPMACGFSCYKQIFNPGMNFAYDLTELGQYIRDYVDLMAHMDSVLPGRVYRLNYEDLVGAPDEQVRGLLDHCGLTFENACLRHHENSRVAQTISSEQVRRPIYAEGLDQWRHFEAWLGPLRLALGST